MIECFRSSNARELPRDRHIKMAESSRKVESEDVGVDRNTSGNLSAGKSVGVGLRVIELNCNSELKGNIK